MLNIVHEPQLCSEQVSLLEELLDTLPLKYRTIVALAYFTSSRIEDILSLKKKNITTEKIIIKQSELGETKYVPILSNLRPYLTVYLNGYEEKESEFVFSDKLGKPLTSSLVFKVLNIVAKKINLPEIYLFVLN
ncbi:MAG: tyrosine-type recombinase/integrase [Crocosphaera sp.]